MDRSILSKCGLDANEAQVYLSLLEHGPSAMTEIAKRTKMNRTTLYSVFGRLEEKGLLDSSIRGKRRVFSAGDPRALGRLLTDRLGAFETVLPDLLAMHGNGTTKPVFRFLEGMAGIRRTFDDSLRANEKTILAFSSPGVLSLHDRALTRYWEGEYIPKRKELKKFVKILVPDDQDGRAFRKGDADRFRETKFVPAMTSRFQVEIHAYDETVACISYSAGQEFAIQIVSKPVAETIKMIWHLLWATAY